MFQTLQQKKMALGRLLTVYNANPPAQRPAALRQEFQKIKLEQSQPISPLKQ